MLLGTVWLTVLLSWLTKALAFVVMIAVIAFVHEFGHYIIAKLAGVKVYEFALGLGHKIFSRRFGETEYSLRWIPLGAFVRPAGMNPDEDELEGESGENLKGRSFAEKNFFVKQAILIGGAGGNLVFAAFLFAAMLFHLGIQSSHIEVSKAPEGKPAAMAGIQAGDVIVSLDDVQVTDASKGIAYIHQHGGVPVKLGVMRYAEQPPVTLPAPGPGFTGELVYSGQGVGVEVLTLEEGKAAAQAGLEPGDVITSVGKKPVAEFSSKEEVLQVLSRGPAPVTFQRPRMLTVTVTPEKQSDGTGLIGIYSTPRHFGPAKPVALVEAVRMGVQRTGQNVILIYTQAVKLLYRSLGKLTVPDEVGGPLKIASEIAKGVDLGWQHLLRLTAFLSLAIGVFNLLPIPALDGGRMFVLLVKTILELMHRVIRPRAKSHEVLGPRGEEIVHFLGFVFLIFLIVVVTWKDLKELVGAGGPETPAAASSAPASDTSTSTATPATTAPAVAP